ncbi:periplasmic nitrate reductase maturation protein NapF [Mesocricetibacter intestinalis]|uniref:Ferredoxin-type protein NapF n=1 Tax=Mesocricetibacter intestinalis TaxID=1521930 RepID=A0A4R6VB06_9PAST|nr:ferredoxin-type protein NapF [Mesocricetibacter intestinalis]TDQ56657.1 periplasmic nitrate reductase maturation protein NapF [Mesocricetibacter intestinalis]
MEHRVARRQFLRGEFLQSLQSPKLKGQRQQAIRPPWAQEEALFTAACTRCDNCIRFCETQILIRAQGGFPQVDFARGECTFCMKCVQACEQPVFRSTEEAPWQYKAQIRPTCLARHNIECRSCEDSCGQRAIRFVPVLKGVAQVRLDPELCTGCGACLGTCPADAIAMGGVDKEAF